MTDKIHFEDWEHVYLATDGRRELRVEAHEWSDWFDEEELEDMEKQPDGAIYYDIYSRCDNGTWGVYDGGVVGYRKGDFRTMEEFKKYLQDFMQSAGQGVTILAALSEEDEEEFWEAAE